MTHTLNSHWPEELIKFLEKETGFSFSTLTVQKLAGDAGSRLYWRISASSRSHSKKNWILLETEPFLDTKDQFPYMNIQSHLLQHQVHVPHIYAVAPSLGVLLVEDFGDNSLEKVTQKLAAKQYGKYYFLALDELFKIHFEASKPAPRCVAFGLAFDTEKLLWELNFMKEHLMKRHLHLTLSPQEEKTLQSSFLDLCKTLDAQPRYFTHRDYHSRNLMIQDEKICVLDFQDARMGPCHYDLASLLKDSYVQLAQELREELLKYYLFEKNKREGKKTDPKEFQKIFNWMSIQRNLKAMGTFGYLHVEKGKSNYLPYLKPTWNSVQENLEKFLEFKELYTLLQKCFKELS